MAVHAQSSTATHPSAHELLKARCLLYEHLFSADKLLFGIRIQKVHKNQKAIQSQGQACFNLLRGLTEDCTANTFLEKVFLSAYFSC